jgi:gluconokinase
MSEKFPRSAYDAVGGMVYFPRMLDKIRLFAAGELPKDYHPHLGVDFDGRCLNFLGVAYDDVRREVLAGRSDEEVFAWCREHGRKLTDEDIEMWSGFLSKRGWRDAASVRIAFRLREAGLESRAAEAITMFDFIDIDEGRTPPDFTKWMPPYSEKV